LIPLPVASPKFENAVVRAADISADIEPVPDVVVEHKAVFVAEHEVVVVEHKVAFVAEHEVVVVEHKVAFVAEHEVVVVEHKVAFVAEHEVAELGFGVFVVAPVPDAAELQASVDILVVFVFSVLASVDAIEVRKPGHPMSFAVPNACHYASSSSCAEVLD
jgi:hypothetical protein